MRAQRQGDLPGSCSAHLGRPELRSIRNRYLQVTMALAVSASDNLDFVPKPIEAVGIRAGEGANIQLSMAVVQRTAALRAYNNYGNCRDWMDKLSVSYVVATATRSADTLLMHHIQNHIVENPPITCAKCREVTLGTHVIRRRLFPNLKLLRTHANTLIHHLDNPENKGIADLNIQGVFDYCYHLFQDNAETLFGLVPEGTFELTKCKQCKMQGS